MHERPIGDLVDALRQLGCAIDYLGRPGFPPLRDPRRRRRRSTLDAPIRVRGDVSSQFLTALLLALPLRRRHGRRVDRGRRRADLQALRRDHAEPAARASASTVERDGWQRFTIARRQRATARPGAIHRRRRRVVGVVLHRRRRDRAATQPLRDRRRRQRLDPGRHRASSMRRARWARRSTPGRDCARGAARPLPARARSTLDCNHIPDAAMTLAALALFADGTTTLDNIASWRVKETDRHRGDGDRAAQARRERRRRRRLPRVTPPARWRAAAIDTYDDHRMAMCSVAGRLQRRARRRRGAAGAHPRPALRRQDLPGLLRGAVRGRRGAAATRSRCITHRRPDGVGQGHARERRRGRRSATTCSTRARCTAPTALAALQARRRCRRRAGARDAGRARCDLRFDAGRICLAGDDVSDALRLEEVGVLASRISAWPRVRARAARPAARRSAACPAWSPTAATWAR